MEIPWGLIIKGLLILAVLFALKYAVTSYNEHQQAIGAARVQALWDAEKAETAAKKLKTETDAALAAKKIDDHQATLTEARNARFSKVDAKTIPAGAAHIRIPSSVVGVLNDVVDAANGSPEGSAAKSGQEAAAPAADTVDADPGSTDLEAVVGWSKQVGKLYSQCTDQVQGLQDLWITTQAVIVKDQQ